MSLTDDFVNQKLDNGKNYYVKMYGSKEVKILQALDDKEDGQVLGDSKFIYTPCEIPEIYDIEEVIAPVPSYEKWKSAYECQIMESEEVTTLKELLKECKEFFEDENPKDFTVISERMDDLLTRINAAIGESEE